MSQTLADDSEVMFDQPEESAGAMETEGSLQNRRRKETWLEATEPNRGARPRMRDFDRPVDGVFDAIVLSNGWGDATAALQLLSHLQDDALSVALLIPMPLQASRRELTDALSSHYGSPGRLANYRREFDKTVRKMGEDPSNFAITLETLAVKAFGNMEQIARLRLIRDRFIAGHENCENLDCVPPDTPLRDIVDRCRVWESHGTTEIRRVSKPIPEPVYPTYVVEQPDYESEPVCMVSVNKQNSQVDQTDELLRKLLEALTPVTPPPPPVRTPKATLLDKLTELLMLQIVKSEPAPPTPV